MSLSLGTGGRAIHRSVRVKFVPNPQPTWSNRVEKFQARRQPRKARVESDRARVGSGRLWFQPKYKDQTQVWFLKNKINRSTTQRENLQTQRTDPQIQRTKTQRTSTNPQINEPKRWNRSTKSERWRRGRARTLRTKSEERRLTMERQNRRRAGSATGSRDRDTEKREWK